MPSPDLLFDVKRLQIDDKAAAEALLLTFVRETFPALHVAHLELRPQATSLNSFNGFLTLDDGTRLFFKTHVEQDNMIDEYYNSEILVAAGYTVIRPLYSSTVSGQHLLIYPVISAPTVFEVARRIETDKAFDSLDAQHLTSFQHQSDDALLTCYLNSLHLQGAEKAAQAPIHQLFWHRLTGGRYDRFYGKDARFALPHGTFNSDSVFRVRWRINGSEYDSTLNDLVKRACNLLNPSRDDVSIIGHGDAHNGNVFMLDDGLTYFDPAFAGRHSPFLDLVKPMFHNVFAMWMYFPHDEAIRFDIQVKHDGVWQIDHDFAVNPLRKMFFASKLERVLRPIVAELRKRGHLDREWRERFKLALMCCPLLTMNLTTFPSNAALLGLCFAVEMGAESSVSGARRSFIDQMLDSL